MPNEQLSQAIASLLARVKEIEGRLAYLEHLALRNSTAEEPQPEPRSEPKTESAAIPRPENPSPTLPPLTSSPPPRFLTGVREKGSASPVSDAQTFETRVGLTWINRIGVVTLVFGAGFLFKYASDNQWIGETGRVVLGLLVGLATLAAAEFFFRRQQSTFAQGICGLGLSILYLSSYASFGFYHLLPQPAAFVLMGLVTALAAALALRYRALAIAILGMLGGYMTPLLLSTGTDSPWIFFLYIVVIDGAAVLLARTQRWRPLNILAFAATVILYQSWRPPWFTSGRRLAPTVGLLAFCALFASVEESWIVYVSQALTGLALISVWRGATPYLFLSLVIGAGGLLIADRTRRPRAAVVSFSTFWIAYALWKVFGSAPVSTGSIFLCITAAFLMYAVWATLRLADQTVARREPLTVLSLSGVVYFGCTYLLLTPDYHAWLGFYAAGLAAAHVLLGIWLWNARGPAERDTDPAFLLFGLALAFATLALPIQFTGIRITLSWAIEAAALAWVGQRLNQNRASFGAIAVYCLVVIRLFVFDTASAYPHALLLNARFATFAFSAVSLWLGAWWMKTVLPPAIWIYTGGHAVMLSALLFELDDWIGKAAAAEDQASLGAISVTILMAAYAVMLIGVGLLRRFRLDRILGVVLVGMVVLKLYLYDVWEAGKLFRTAAFITLGALLLLASYLYSRLRPAVQNWLNEDNVRR